MFYNNTFDNNYLNFTSSILNDEQDIFPNFAFVMDNMPTKNDIFSGLKNCNFDQKDEIESMLGSNNEEENSTDLSLSNKEKQMSSDNETDTFSNKEASPKKAVETFEERCNPNYNAWVDEILEISEPKSNEDALEKPLNREVIIRNRRKLTKVELSFLEREYERTQGQDWDKAYITMLAKKINLPYYKVYKWNWDRKKKDLQSHRLPLKAQTSAH